MPGLKYNKGVSNWPVFYDDKFYTNYADCKQAAGSEYSSPGVKKCIVILGLDRNIWSKVRKLKYRYHENTNSFIFGLGQIIHGFLIVLFLKVVFLQKEPLKIKRF